MSLTCWPLPSKGERCCLSGACINLPCFDKYASNRAGCCCCEPKYSDTVYEFSDFFATVLPQLHTGDIVFTSWPVEGQFGTSLSRCLAHSRWSHTGLVYRPSDCPDILKHHDRLFGDVVHPSRPLLAQMLAGGEMGCRVAPERGGLDLVDAEVFWKDYMDKYSHSEDMDPDDAGVFIVGVRMLVGVERDDAFYRHFEETLTKYWDTPYEDTVMRKDVILGAIDCCQNFPCCQCFVAVDDDSMLFCSQLNADVFKAVGLIDKNLVSSEYYPASFDTTRRLKLLDGAGLTREHITFGPDSWEERQEMGYPPVKPREAQPSGDNFGKPIGSLAGGYANVDVGRPIASLPCDHAEIAPEQCHMLCCSDPESDLDSDLE